MYYRFEPDGGRSLFQEPSEHKPERALSLGYGCRPDTGDGLLFQCVAGLSWSPELLCLEIMENAKSLGTQRKHAVGLGDDL